MRGIKIVIFFVFLLVFLLLPRQSLASTISNLSISNVLERGFTVSWTSAETEKGSVSFGVSTTLGTTASDIRGMDKTANTHYVMIGNLIPSTKYYFSVISGTTVDNNNGSFYTVTTGPILSVPPSDIAYGKILGSNNSVFSGAIIYITIVDNDNQGGSGRSTLLSGITNDNGGWTINLGNARTNNLLAYFSYSLGDKLEIRFYGGSGESVSKIFAVSASKPISDIVLTSSGGITATPTLIPAPTLTPGVISRPTPTLIPAPDSGLDFPALMLLVTSLLIITFGTLVYFAPSIPVFQTFEKGRRKKELENTFSKDDKDHLLL